jgi:hypothetical protein
MTRDQKRAPEEVWDALVKMALEEDVDDVSTLSDAELDAKLAAEGFDPKKIRERGRELGARLAAGEAEPVGAGWVSEPPPPAPVRMLTRRSLWLLAAALAALIGGGVTVAVGAWSKHEPKPIDDHADSAPEIAPAPPSAPAPPPSSRLRQMDPNEESKPPKPH